MITIFSSPIMTAGAQVSQDNFVTFGKSIFGFSIKHPLDWEVNEYDRTIRDDGVGYQTIATMCPRSEAERGYCPEAKQLVLAVRNLPQNTTHEDLIDYLDTVGRFEFTGYKTENTTNTTMAGFPAVRSTYTYLGDYENETEIIKGIEIIAFNESKAYAISYFSPQLQLGDLFPTVQKMIDSIKIYPMPPCNFVNDKYGGKCQLTASASQQN